MLSLDELSSQAIGIMEFIFSSFPIILCFIFFIFMLTTPRKPNSKLPPGPWKLPFIGNLHQMVGSQPHRVLANLAKKHGPLMYLQLGEIPTLVLSSAEYAEQVMKTHDIVFASRPLLSAAKIITYNFTSITFAPYGEYWKQLKKLCVVELLSMKRVQLLQPIREKEVSKLIKWVYAESGSPINLSEKIFSTIYGSVSRMVFSERVETADEYVSIVKDLSRLLAGFTMADAFPSIKLFHLISGVSSDLENVTKKGSKILGDVIHQRIKAKTELKNQNQKKKEEEEDLLDVLLKFHGDESDDKFTLSIDNLKAIIQDMFAAGSDSTSAAVDWAMTEMIRHPRVMEKAQAEVRRAFDNNVSFSDSELKYLKLIIKETLRLHLANPLLLPRENNERCEINGYEIPAKTRVLVNAWVITRDPKYWGVDAEKFYPERFVDNHVDFKGQNFEYIPFGAGRRMCPGITFGLTNVEYLLSQLLYYFDWKLPSGLSPEDVDMTDHFGLTMRRRNDLYLIPTPYLPSLLTKP